MNEDLKQLKEELGEAFFAQFLPQEPALDNTAIEYAKQNGFMSFSDYKAQNIEKEIWAFFDRDRTETYYQKKAVSYSFLKHLERLATGKSGFKSNNYKPFLLGRAFEDMFTDRFNATHFPTLIIQVLNECRKWVDNAMKNEYVNEYYFGEEKPEIQKETIREWRGLLWKCKTDAESSNQIVDLKTTSAKSEAEFIKACVKFGYFTQGYVYMMLTGKPNFTLLGVSKKVSDVFNVSLNIYSETAKEAESELDRLLGYLDYFGIRKEFEVSP
ncbi:MAG: PD-(D/E)XK nuclease-like domain-containing protein [Planktothrix sp.]